MAVIFVLVIGLGRVNARWKDREVAYNFGSHGFSRFCNYACHFSILRLLLAVRADLSY